MTTKRAKTEKTKTGARTPEAHPAEPAPDRLSREHVQALSERDQNALRAEAFGLLVKASDDTLTEPEDDRLDQLIRCGMLPSDPPPPQPITKERNGELKEIARQRNAAAIPDPELHALAVKIQAAGGRDKAHALAVSRFDELLKRPGAGGRSVPAILESDAEVER
jgi:hypothetical protein